MALVVLSSGPRPCENAKTPGSDRRSYSSTIILALKLASAFHLESELKNRILAVFRSFEFSHGLGQQATSGMKEIVLNFISVAANPSILATGSFAHLSPLAAPS